jgi:hypothetical protein
MARLVDLVPDQPDTFYFADVVRADGCPILTPTRHRRDFGAAVCAHRRHKAVQESCKNCVRHHRVHSRGTLQRWGKNGCVMSAVLSNLHTGFGQSEINNYRAQSQQLLSYESKPRPWGQVPFFKGDIALKKLNTCVDLMKCHAT